MTALNAPLVQSNKPESFLERGVAVPFTTPQLAGARIRHAERTGTEFVVPNPSGGRGVYILSWSGVRQLCRPTVHDTLLHQRISRLASMDPGGVRRVAQKLAAEGLAGSDATAAALAAADMDRNQLILVNFLMLIMLMEQLEPGLLVSAETERTPELDRRARRIVTQLAGSIGRGVAQISADLEALSMLYVPIGLEAEMPDARLPRLIARLEATGAELTKWSQRYAEDGCAGLAFSLSQSALVTAGCAGSTVRIARGLTGDIRGLLQLWAANPAAVVRQTGRPEWILDGWERFCLLWETADHISVQRAVLREMAQLVPMLPREASDWKTEREELEKLEPVLRAAQINASWRGGAASHGLIARNERLQGLIR